MRKIALLILVFLLLSVTPTLAFELVEKDPEKLGNFSVGYITGVAIGPMYFASYSALDIQHSFNERIALKGSIGIQEYENELGVSSPKLLVTLRPTFVLLYNEKDNLYINGLVTNLTPSLLTLGFGAGLERSFLDFTRLRLTAEFDCTLDLSLIYSFGFKYYF